jgi:glycosyltransferase involved in cell wall biosynthesis
VNLGVGGALRTGFRYAVANGFDRAVQVDGDGQHDPAQIPVLLEAADNGTHLVVGTRFADESYTVSRSRRSAMRMLSRLVRWTTGLRLDDVTSGFRVISEPLLSRFAIEYPAEYLGDTVEAIVIAHRSGACVDQVPVAMAPRATGKATSRTRAAGHVARVLLALTVRRARTAR